MSIKPYVPSDKAHNKEVLKVGVIKAVLVYISIGLLVYLGTIIPELSVMIANELYTLQGAIELGLFSSVLYYSGQSVIKLFKLINAKPNLEPVEVSKVDLSAEINHLMEE